jgi:hypothetical protein
MPAEKRQVREVLRFAYAVVKCPVHHPDIAGSCNQSKARLHYFGSTLALLQAW